MSNDNKSKFESDQVNDKTRNQNEKETIEVDERDDDGNNTKNPAVSALESKERKNKRYSEYVDLTKITSVLRMHCMIIDAFVSDLEMASLDAGNFDTTRLNEIGDLLRKIDVELGIVLKLEMSYHKRLMIFVKRVHDGIQKMTLLLQSGHHAHLQQSTALLMKIRKAIQASRTKYTRKII